MRVLAVFTLSIAGFLTPQLIVADPSQPDAAPPGAGAQQSTTQVAPVAPAGNAAPAASEQVVVRPPASESNPDEIVCRSTAARTGSRIGGGRECHTQREWDRQMRESQRLVGGSQLRSLEGAPGGGGTGH